MTNFCTTSNSEKDLRKLCFLVIWLSINCLLFWYEFSIYYNGIQYYYLNEMLGYGLCMSRASAACINLNSALLLMPMCRKLSGYLLKLFQMPDRCQTMSLYRWIHTYCAYMLCVMTAVHCVAHSFNAMNFCKHFDPQLMEINLAKVPNQKAWLVMLKTWPGISGVLLLITLTTITLFAVKPIRKANYDRFLKSHYLFVLFYVLLLLHSLNGVIKYQTNVGDHKPGCHVSWSGNMTSMKMTTKKNDTSNTAATQSVTQTLPQPTTMQPQKNMKMNANWKGVMMPPHIIKVGNSTVECSKETPKFASCKQRTWMWLCIPMFCYLLERLHRLCVANHYSANITDVTFRSGEVLQVKMMLNGFRVKPGQSIGVRCPKISQIEMHPFSVTSANQYGDYNCEIFIKCCGDWTNQLKSIVTEMRNNYRQQQLLIDTKTCNYQPGEKQHVNNRTDFDAAFHEEPELDSFKCTDNNSKYSKPSSHDGLENMDNSNDQIKASNCLIPSQCADSPSSLDIKGLRTKSGGSRMVLFPRIVVEGPFSSCLQSVMNYKATICVAGGVGITPFISLINHLICIREPLSSIKMQRFDLVWTCRNVTDLSWFSDEIRRLRCKVWSEEIPDFFTVALHVTGKNEDEEKSCFDWKSLEGILITRGRPNIRRKFEEFAKTNPRRRVGVFCCGPKGLVSSVKKSCEESYPNKTSFKYHKETFT